MFLKFFCQSEAREVVVIGSYDRDRMNMAELMVEPKQNSRQLRLFYQDVNL